MADIEETISHVNELEGSKTTENEEGKEAIQRGNDWEVVSMTASTYAAAPGPRGDESIHEDSHFTVSGNDEAETSQALFMSGHFVFPPSQHENLPIAPEKLETPKGAKEDDLFAVLKEGKHEDKIDEKWGIEGLAVKEEFPSIPFFEERGHMTLSGLGPEFNESISRLGLSVDDKEQNLFGGGKLSSFSGSSAAYDVSAVVNDLVEASDDMINPSYLRPQAPKSVKKDEDDDSELPCGAWWKKGVDSLCAHAKETSAFWSIFVAAAVMGLVVLGQRWHLNVGDEKSGRFLSGVKDVILGGNRRGTYITAGSADH